MADPLAIAYLTSVYARAGDTFIRGEVKQLRRRGARVHTFSIRRADEGENVSEEVRQEQATTDYILERGWGRLIGRFLTTAFTNPTRMLSAVKLAWQTCPPGLKATLWQLAYLIEASYLARRVRQMKIEHIHNHIPANSATVCMLASRLAGIPYSMTVHGPHIFYEPIRWALATKVKESAFTVCISSFCKSQCMIFTPPGEWEKLKVVRCGLDETFLSSPSATIPSVPCLVCVGRLCPEKGQLMLVEAAAQLRAEGLKLEVALIGDGPLRPAIQRLICRHALEDTVKMAGWKGSAQVRDEILRSRALVLPSLSEGLPVVIMEAMALGRPVISTCIAGIPELVEHTANGYLVPAGCLKSLVEAMRQVLTSAPEPLEQMGREGAKRVAAHHNATTEAGKLEALFRQSVDFQLQPVPCRPGIDPTTTSANAPHGVAGH